MNKTLLATATLLLTACGSGDDPAPTAPPPVEPPPTNAAPQWLVEGLTTQEDTPLTVSFAELVQDGDGDTLKLTIDRCGEAWGCALGDDSLILTPAENFHGEQSLELSVSDGTDNLSTTLLLTVEPVNDAPVWFGLPEASLVYGESLTLDLAPYASDIEDDALSYSLSNCAEQLSCALDGTELTISEPARAGRTFTLTLSVTDGTADTEIEWPVAVERAIAANLEGVEFFPPYNGLSGDSQVTLSLTSEQPLEQIVINGETLSLTEQSQWQQSYPLALGDTVFEVAIETATHSLPLQRVVRYAGDMHQGSSGVAFLDEHTLLVDDYRADALVIFDLETQETRAYSAEHLTGLSIEQLDFYAPLDSERILASVWDFDQSVWKLVEINLTDKTSTEILDLGDTPGRADHLTTSADGGTLYFIHKGSRQNPDTMEWDAFEEFYRYELAGQNLTLLADTAQAADGITLNSVKTMVLDEVNQRLLLADWDWGSDQGQLLSLALTGADQDRLTTLTTASDPGCLDFASREVNYSSPIRDGVWYLVMQNERWATHQLPLDTLCLSEHHRVPESLFLNDESLQGVDVHPTSGEIVLGFYPGPLLYQPTTGEYRSAEVEGFSGAPWGIQEPTAVHYHAEQHRLVYGDEDVLMSLDLRSGELSELARPGEDILKLVWDEARQRYYLYDEYDGLLSYDLARGELEYLVASDAGSYFGHPALGADGRLFFIEDEALKAIDLDTLAITEISAEDPAFSLDDNTALMLDIAGQRAIVETQGRTGSAFVAIDLADGSRSTLVPEQRFASNDYLALSPDGSAVWYYSWSEDTLMSLELASQSTTPLLAPISGHYQFGDPTGIHPVNGDLVWLADDDFGGFWMVNLATGEKLLYR
ncbi:Ig-like domain-containing protein [Ferrimonas marina]|nr:Ig-like domain-containing protein [Ferrimonas marina]